MSPLHDRRDITKPSDAVKPGDEALHDLQRRADELEQQNQALRSQLAEVAAARETAEAANRAKTAFLAQMCHELRTPMNGVLGMVELALRGTGDIRQGEWLAQARNSGRHLLALVNDVLDLSRVEAGKLTLEDAEFSLDDLLARTLEIVGGMAREKGLELVLDASRLPDRVRGDPTRLSQVLINLLDNAIKFTHRGWVQLRGECLQTDAQGLLLRFEVQDTGEGIAPDRQLFDAFTQAEASTARRHGGTGLGLALTRQLTQLMGGEVGFDSQLGAGSRFWFSVKLSPAAAGPVQEPALPAGLRALVVDDLPEALAAAAACLQALGVEVVCESSGSAALATVAAAQAAGRPYDLVLLDWRMPPPDGIETARQLQRLPQAARTAVILMASYDDALLRHQAREARIATVLVKPLTLPLLRRCLAAVIGGAEAPPAAPPEVDSEALLRRDHSGQRIVVAEDNPVSQQVVVELLRAVGLVVEAASDGRSALDLALARPCDLVLLDMRMPLLDGPAVARAIRARASMPIVALTAHAFNEDRAACLEAGMNDFLTKPVDPRKLYESLLRWLPPSPHATAAVAPAAAPRARAPLLDKLNAIEGLDARVALRNVGARMAGLEGLLRSFVESYGDGEPALFDLDSGQQLESWRAACHSLRGACAVIGAMPLVSAVQRLENSLDASTDLAALAAGGQRVNDDLIELAARLRSALGG